VKRRVCVCFFGFSKIISSSHTGYNPIYFVKPIVRVPSNTTTCFIQECLYVSVYEDHISPPLTLILLTLIIWRAPNNASKWHMGFNLAFEGLNNFGNKIQCSANCASCIGSHMTHNTKLYRNRWIGNVLSCDCVQMVYKRVKDK
jgi:hypothetical protein